DGTRDDRIDRPTLVLIARDESQQACPLQNLMRTALFHSGDFRELSRVRRANSEQLQHRLHVGYIESERPGVRLHACCVLHAGSTELLKHPIPLSRRYRVQLALELVEQRGPPSGMLTHTCELLVEHVCRDLQVVEPCAHCSVVPRPERDGRHTGVLELRQYLGAASQYGPGTLRVRHEEESNEARPGSQADDLLNRVEIGRAHV